MRRTTLATALTLAACAHPPQGGPGAESSVDLCVLARSAALIALALNRPEQGPLARVAAEICGKP